MNISENTKVTLTLGQLKRLVREGCFVSHNGAAYPSDGLKSKRLKRLRSRGEEEKRP